MPPKPVRRLAVAPLVAALDAAVVLVSPLSSLVSLAASPVLGGRRPLRATLMATTFAARHLQAMASLARLGARGARATRGDGGGRPFESEAMQAAHYAVMRRFVSGTTRALVRHARAEVLVEESEAAYEALSAGSGRPIVLLSRHAGEGDTLLVLHELLCRHDRRPHLVLHEALRLDPVIDLLGDRLPNRFVDPRGGDTEREIAAMARELDGRSALVIFPEGANFTPESHRRGIERLERGGHDAQAEVARGMRHVSAPRPGGALAAIDAAPGADVVIFGHVGFPTGVRETWRRLPEHQPIRVRLWHEPAETIPRDHEARIAWLFERWRELDDWIGSHASPPGAAGKA